MTAPASQNTPPDASRGPPAQVAPVVIDGISYRQIAGSPDTDGQAGGLLGAYGDDGQQLWRIKVYDNARRDDIEGDVQDVFFRSMEQRPDGTLLIVNERGERYAVDVAGRTSTRIMAPADPLPRPGMLPRPGSR